jgi:hypothetical protein
MCDRREHMQRNLTRHKGLQVRESQRSGIWHRRERNGEEMPYVWLYEWDGIGNHRDVTRRPRFGATNILLKALSSNIPRFSTGVYRRIGVYWGFQIIIDWCGILQLPFPSAPTKKDESRVVGNLPDSTSLCGVRTVVVGKQCEW